MKKPHIKPRKETSPRRKGILLVGLFVLCMIGVVLYSAMKKTPQQQPSSSAKERRIVVMAEPEEVQQIQVEKNGERRKWLHNNLYRNLNQFSIGGVAERHEASPL